VVYLLQSVDQPGKWRVFVASVASVDGTTIDYDIAGSGPVIVFVAGVFNLRDTFTSLAAELSSDHTVLSYDRRGRGKSSDSAPYRVEREVEDLQAIIEVAGGSASVFGFSSGAILALKAVADGVAVERLYLYEPPFRFDENQPAPPADLPARLQALLDAGDAGAVVATFQIEWVGLPREVVNGARRSPMWTQFETMAQSAVYDAVSPATSSGRPRRWRPYPHQHWCCRAIRLGRSWPLPRRESPAGFPTPPTGYFQLRQYTV
jgi:pimeloyl-ACP methyl ester carboxylesterase